VEWWNRAHAVRGTAQAAPTARRRLMRRIGQWQEWKTFDVRTRAMRDSRRRVVW
jgi:hypothetical protein